MTTATQKKRIQQFIARAQAAGSSATTLRGAGRYLIDHARDRSFTTMWEPQSREAYYLDLHRTRLVARYATARRLPAYLSAQDKAFLGGNDLAREIRHLRAMPAYARELLASDAARALLRRARLSTVPGALTGTWSTIAADAFSRADFGRARRIHKGENRLHAGIRTESYQRGRNPWGGKWVHHDYYADYTLIRPVRHGNYYQMYYVAPDRSEHTVRVSPHFLRIDHDLPTHRTTHDSKPYPLPVHVQRRLLARHLPAVLRLGYDRTRRELLLVDARGEQYHLPHIQTDCDREGTQVRRLIHEAVTAFRKRRAEHLDLRRVDLTRVYVQIDDSLTAGNCRTATESFAAQLWSSLHSGPAAVRADVILSMRDDAYTRRAIQYAATRSEAACTA